MIKLKEICRKALAVVLSTVTVLATAGISQAVYAYGSDSVRYEQDVYEVRTSGDWEYIVVSNSAIIVGCNSKSPSIVVPDKIDECQVSAIAYKDNYWSSVIKKGAFEENTTLQSITIPGSVKTIDKWAFKSCTGLQQVLVGEGVQTIGESAFESCKALQRIVFKGNTVTSIGEKAFYECDTLDGVTIPSSVTEIGSFSFAGCDALSEITVPDSVTELGAASFYNCRALSKAVIGNGIDKLESSDSLSVYSGGSEEYGAGMFEKCTNLTIVELGE